MARSRRRRKRPVLYEVIRRLQRTPTGANAPPETEPELPPTPAPAPAKSRREPLRALQTIVAKRRSAPRDEPPRPGVVQLVDRHVILTLSWYGSAVLVLGLVCVLAVTFGAGARYARQAQLAPSTSETGSTESAADVPTHRPLGGNVAVPPRSTGRSAPAGRDGSAPANVDESFQPGYHYIVVQHLPKSRLQAARDAAEFLRSRGVACTVRRAAKDIELIASEPFLMDQDDKASARAARRRCEDLKRHVRQVGKDYNVIGGYDFSGCEERRF